MSQRNTRVDDENDEITLYSVKDVDPYVTDIKNKVCSKLLSRERRTPDFRELRWYKSIMVFVYGDEKLGYLQTHLLRGAKRLGIAHTTEPKFILKTGFLNNRPVGFTADDLKQPGKGKRLRGEAYLVDVGHMHMLDCFHFNGEMSRRKRYNISIESEGTWEGFKFFGGMPLCEAFVYTAIPKYYKDMQLNDVGVSQYLMGDDRISELQFYEFVNSRTKGPTRRHSRLAEMTNEEFAAYQEDSWGGAFDFRFH